MASIETISKPATETLIHPSAVIHPTAKIADKVQIGPWVQIGPHVTIGESTVIDSHVVIASHTIIGKHNRIYSFAAVGGDPQDHDYQGEEVWLEVGDHNTIREYCTINRGSKIGTGKTIVGNHCLLLAYTHIAHDCILDDHVTMVNHATLAGHVHVHHHAIIGAFTAIHQFCQIGAYSFLARLGQATQDIMPFMLATGMPAYPRGLNLVGLRRNGFSNATIKQLKKAFHVIYDRRSGKIADAVEALKEMLNETPEIQFMLDFIENSKRGIARATGGYESLSD